MAVQGGHPTMVELLCKLYPEASTESFNLFATSLRIVAEQLDMVLLAETAHPPGTSFSDGKSSVRLNAERTAVVIEDLGNEPHPGGKVHAYGINYTQEINDSIKDVLDGLEAYIARGIRGQRPATREEGSRTAARSGPAVI